MHTLAIICLTIFTVSATAYQCCLPDQYQGVFRKAYTKHPVHNKATFHSEEANVYTDFINGREFLDVVSATDDYRKFQVLSDYSSGFFYFSAYGQCLFKIAMMSTLMRNKCDYCTKSVSLGQDYYGLGSNSLNVNILKGKDMTTMSTNFPASQRVFVTSMFMVDSQTILPVFERGSFVAMDKSTIYYNTDHSHFQTTISDTSVFNVPNGCMTDNVGFKEFDKILMKKYKESQSD